MDKIVKNASPNWGGHRPGSGRKPTGRVKNVMYITEEEHRQIKLLLEEMRGK